MTSSASDTVLLQPDEVFSQDELNALVDRIIESGELGRSKIYAALLRYFVEKSRSAPPKEIEIAIDVLGRDERFDVSRDSVVRVYIHQLRKKLDSYYLKHEQNASHRLIVPKGQYQLAVLRLKEPAPTSQMPDPGGTRNRPRRIARRHSFRNAAMLSLIILLALNLIYMISGGADSYSRSPSVIAEAAAHEFWRPVLDDELPVTLVLGDYYIFGELNEAGDVRRMIRDFNINSRQDLDRLFRREQEASWQYRDLDLSYVPEGSAFTLAQAARLLHTAGKKFQVSMMSDLSTADLKSSHVVYIGYVSGLDKLTNPVFSASGLRIGSTYDELVNRDTGQRFSSDAGLPSESGPFRESFRDYAMISTFPFGSESHVVVLAGTRDAGLMHAGQAVTDPSALSEMLAAAGGEQNVEAFESLYEVVGFGRMNFDATLNYSNVLNPRLIWGAAER